MGKNSSVLPPVVYYAIVKNMLWIDTVVKNIRLAIIYFFKRQLQKMIKYRCYKLVTKFNDYRNIEIVNFKSENINFM